MNNQTLVIYDFKILYEILNEISDHLNFKLTNIKKITDLDLNAQNNYLVISNKKIKDIENQIVIKNFPISSYFQIILYIILEIGILIISIK